MRLERDAVQGDEDELEYESRSIFAAGWFRAVLVLTSLALAVVIALPYLLYWLEPSPSATKTPAGATRGPEPSPAAARPAPAELGAATVATPARPAPATPAALQRTPPPVELAKSSASERSAPRPAAGSLPARGDRVDPRGGHWVQLGTFKEPANAERLAKRIREQGFAVEVASVRRSAEAGAPAGTYHLVRAGAFADRARALAASTELGTRGYSGFLTEGAAR